jgi:hypothetical protein
MSRATWYRLGKPSTRPKPRPTVSDLAKALGATTRTYQRIIRVMLDPDLAPLVAAGALKPGKAEQLLTNPQRKRRFLRMLLKASKAQKRKSH